MLTDRAGFLAWLARHDASIFEQRERLDWPIVPPEPRDSCDGCGGPLGDTPSRAGEECLICLAEQYASDRAYDELLEKFVGGVIREAIDGRDPRFLPPQVREIVDRAIVEVEQKYGRGEAC